MKGVVRSLLLFLCATLFIFPVSVCVYVVRVHADTTATYLQLTECIDFYVSGNYYYSIQNVTGYDTRCVYLKNPNTNRVFGYVVMTTDNNGSSYSKHTSNSGSFASSCASNNTGAEGYITEDNIKYGYRNYKYNYSYSNYLNPDVPIIETTDLQPSTALYYTFGEGAVDPIEPVNWGLVDVKGYQTNIAGQGTSAINNVDIISWNNHDDTLGNDITEGNVRIRFVPGEYRASSKSNLLQQTYNDFVLSIIDATAGNVFPVTDGSASFSWAEVIDVLRIPFWSIYNITNTTEGWLKRGWIYQVRLEIDDYVGEWQTVYASTSSGVENDLTIVNTTVITQETITAIQNINSINSTTNIWIINGTPVDPSPEYEPPASNDEKPWWAYLLEMINNTLGIQNQYINEGTDESIDIVNNFEEDHDDLNVTVNDYDNIENNIVDDMNNNIDDLDIESDLIENNSFLSSARWVAEQYTRITTNNPIGSILKFSLVLGFVMIFLGRFK